MDRPLVISVGALELGGSGKTPVAMEISRRLIARGLRVGLLSRGYGRGDEALLHRHRLPDAIVRCHRDRASLVEAVSPSCDAIVLDDAFQHRRCARDIDVLVQDPWAEGCWLLRERPRSAHRAHMVWWHRRDGGDVSVEPRCRDLPAQIRSRFVPRERDLLRGLRVHLMSGIARADAFRRLCDTMGATLLGWSRFRDHHWFRARDLDRVWTAARREGADAVVTTEKDRMRLTTVPESPRLLVLAGDVELSSGESQLDQMLAGACAR